MRTALREVEEGYRKAKRMASSASDVVLCDERLRQHQMRIRSSFSFELSIVHDPRAKVMEELQEIYQDCSAPNWDGHGATPVNALTFELVQRIIEDIPAKLPVPELSIDPDGELVLEWRRGKDKLLSISVALNGRLSFIYRNGATRMRDTVYVIDGRLPQELTALVDLLKR